MRTMIISALLLTAAATGAQAQSGGQASTDIGAHRRDTGPYYGGSLVTNDAMTKMDQQAIRILQARRAAELINAGKCDKALSYVAARNDDYLTQRVGEVCAAPRS